MMKTHYKRNVLIRRPFDKSIKYDDNRGYKKSFKKKA